MAPKRMLERPYICIKFHIPSSMLDEIAWVIKSNAVRETDRMSGLFLLQALSSTLEP